MADISFSAGMDSDGMEKAYQRMIRENGKLREEMTKLATQSREAADKDREYKRMQIESVKRLKAEQEGLAAAAAKIMESVRTPFERYKKNAEELRQHLQAGRIGTDDYRAALAKLAKEYKQAAANTDEARAAQAAAAAAQVKASKEAKAAQDAENAVLREAAQVIDRTRTKQERYAENVARLNKLRRDGKIDGETHSRAIKAEVEAMTEGAPKVQSFGARVGEMAAGMLGANLAMAAGSKAVELLRAEYDRLIERQSEMANAQITLASAQENALANLDTSMSATDFLKRMRTESQKLGVSEKDLTTASADALSAKGDKTAAESVDAVVAASKFKRFGSSGEKASLAGTALDFGKAFGMTPEEALGFLAKAQGPSRVVSAGGMSENIAPAIIGAGQFGVAPNQAAAMAAAMTSTSVDKTGAQTKTTMASLLEQLREFGKAENGFVGDAGYKKEVARIEAEYDAKRIDKKTKNKLIEKETAKLKDGDAWEMFNRVQDDPELRKQFFAEKKSGGFGASFEKQMIAAVEGLLTRGTQTNREYLNATDVMGQISNQGAFDREISKKLESEAIQTAILDQQMGSTNEQVMVGDTAQARSGVIRKRLEELRGSLGGSLGMEQSLTGALEDFNAGGTQTLDTAIQSLTDQRSRVGEGYFTMAPTAEQSHLLTAEQREQVKLLTQLIDQLKDLNAITKQQADLKQGNVNAGRVLGQRANQGEQAP